MDLVFKERAPEEAEASYFPHSLNTLYINGTHLQKQYSLTLKKFSESPEKMETEDVDIDTDDLYLPSPYEQVETIIDSVIQKKPEIEKIEENKEVRQESARAMSVIKKHSLPTMEEILKTSENINLESFTNFAHKNNRYLQEHQRERNYIFSPYDIQQNYETGKTKQKEPIVLAKLPEVLYKIAIYHPLTNKKSQEYLIPGSFSLHELKKAMYCVTNILMELYESSGGSFFFIENCFYEDDTEIPIAEKVISESEKSLFSKSETEAAKSFKMSSSHQRKSFKYSQSNYAADSAIPKKKFTKKSMLDTKWQDLTLRIGIPYLFRHKGCCDHFVVVHDIRLAEDTDPTSYTKYPLLVFQSKTRRTLCNICCIKHAQYICAEDRLSPDRALYLCEECYKLTHYDSNGELLYSDFTLIPYYHDL